MSKPKPPTYSSTKWHDYCKALARRVSLSIWFEPETQWLAAPIGKSGVSQPSPTPPSRLARH